MVFGFIKKAFNRVFSKKEKKEKDRVEKKVAPATPKAKDFFKAFKKGQEAAGPREKMKGNLGAYDKRVALTRRRAYLAAISRQRNRRLAKKKFRRSGKIAIGH